MNEHQQTKTFSPEDSRLTAYALGELNGAECAEVETLLKNDPEARAAVEEIRALAAQLEGALAGESLTEPVVGVDARDGEGLAMEAKAAKVSPNASGMVRADVKGADDPYRKKVIQFPYVWVGTLAAACFAVMFALREERPAQVAEFKGMDKQATEAGNGVAGGEVASSQTTADMLARIQAGKRDGTLSADAASGPRSRPAVLLVKDAEEAAAIPVPEVRGLSGPTDASMVGSNASVAAIISPPAFDAAAPKKEFYVSSEYRADSPYFGLSEEVVTLSPFEVKEAANQSYAAGATLAGSQMQRSDGYVGAGGAVVSASSSSWGDTRSGVNFFAGGVASGRNAFNTEAYAFLPENDFFRVSSTPLSTFSVDVDTASYANVRRFLDQGRRPPRDAVRVEEMVNYFNYRYTPPTKDVAEPFAASMEIATAPWNPAHRLVRIGLKGREVATENRPAANLVFLLDVSGSMSADNKLPLVKESLRLLVEKLRADDRVAIVTYAGNSGLALASTAASKKAEILGALDELSPGGSTNGAMGIQLAYDIAKANFIANGANRVILCTDGDFNVGTTSDGELTRLIEEKAKSGVFLTVLGFGMGNLKDSTLERLADKGNGNYGYIDSRAEAQKLLVEQAGGTLVTIAKDVKLQVEFNPAVAQAYRLIGYENRALKKEDFNNDKVDAGEIGAGHTVTALYEIVPVGAPAPESSAGDVDALKYQTNAPVVAEAGVAADRDNPELRASTTGGEGGAKPSEELLTLKIRFKEPAVDVSRKMEIPVIDTGAAFEAASKDFKFAAAVASLGMILRESAHSGAADYDRVISWAEAGKGDDVDGRRGEFIELVKKARALSAE